MKAVNGRNNNNQKRKTEKRERDLSLFEEMASFRQKIMRLSNSARWYLMALDKSLARISLV
jgi:hypothetical protein